MRASPARTIIFAVFVVTGTLRAEQPASPPPNRQLERLTRWLASKDVASRLDAVRELTSLHSPEATTLLLQAAKDPSAEVRDNVAWSLKNIDDERARITLKGLLKDGDDRVRAAAVWALSNVRDRSVLPDIMQLARTDPSGIVRFRAVWGLGIIGDKSALPVVINAIGDYNISVRERSVVQALGSLADKSVTSRVLSQTNNILPASRRLVMYLLSRYSDDAAVVPALKTGLKDADATVRGEAALALGRLKAKSAAPDLITTLKDADEHVRGSAGYALGLIGDTSAMPALRALSSDESAFVRAVAAESLQKMGDKTAKPLAGFSAADLFTFPIFSAEHPELYR